MIAATDPNKKKGSDWNQQGVLAPPLYAYVTPDQVHAWFASVHVMEQAAASEVPCHARQVVAAGSAIGDMALHFIEKYGMMALRIPSKFDLRRFCRHGSACLPCPDPESARWQCFGSCA